MADGTTVEVKLTATGGEQAAAEIKKVETAVTGETTTIQKLEKELQDAKAAYKAAAVGSEQFADASKRLEKAQAKLTEATGKVTKSGVQMGSNWQNVGYQVQDVAVQIGSGTSAVRALGQQLPQLLSGFGPVGVAIGAVSAVALPLAGALLNTGESAEVAGERAEAAAGKLKTMQEAQAAIIGTQLDKSWADFIKALDDQDAAVQRANIALARRQELMDAINAAQDKLDTAKTQEELAAVDADTTLSEPDKIAKKAAITAKAAKRGADKEIAAVTGAADEAEAEAARKQEAARLAQEKRQAVLEEKQKDDAEQKALEKSEKAKQIAAEKAKQQEEVVKKGAFKTAALSYIPIVNATDFTYDRQAEQAEKQQALEDLRNQAAANPQGPARLTALKSKEAERKAELDRRVEEERAAREAANDAGLAAENKRKIAAEVVPRLQETAAVTTRQRQNVTQPAIVAAVKKTADTALKDQEKDAREAGRQELVTRRETLDDTARQKGLDLRKTGGAEANDTYKSVEAALLDGTDADELQKLGDLVREASGKNGAAVTAFLLQIIDSFNAQAKDIETLKRRLGNK